MDPILPISPLTPSSNVGQELEAKLQQTEAAGLQKRAQLNGITPQAQLLAEFHQARSTMLDAEIRAYYGPEAADAVRADKETQRQAEDTAMRNRTGDEMVRDIPLSMARTAVSLVGGLGQIALDHNQGAHMLQNGALGDRGKQTMDKIDTTVSDALSGVDRVLAHHMSAVSQANDAIVGQQDTLSQVQHKAEYDTALANGANPIVAGAVRLGKDVVTGAQHTAENPTVLSNMAIGQVPTLGIGVVSKTAVTADAVAARAALLQERAMATAAKTGATTPAREALLAEARQQLATRNLQIGVGATEGGGAYQQTFAADLQRQRDAGVSEDQLDVAAARQAATVAAAIQAPLAAATGRIAAEFELDPAGAHLLKDAISGTRPVGEALGHAITDVAKEGLEETLQSGTGQLAQNLGERTVNPNQDILDGVGTAAGQGGIAAVGMATPMQAPGAIASTAIEAGQNAVDALVSRGRAAMKYLNQGSNKQVTETNHAVMDTAAALHDTLAQVPGAERTSAVAPVAADSSLSEGTKAALGVTEQPELSTAEAMGRALAAFNHPDTTPERKRELAFFGLKTRRQLEDSLGQLEQAHADSQDPAQQAHLERVGSLMASLADSHITQQMEAHVAALPEAELEKQFAAVSAASTLSENDPVPADVQQALDQIRETWFVAPEKVPAKVIDDAIALYQRSGKPLSPTEQAQADLAKNLSQLQTQYSEALARSAERTGKTQAQVASEIRDDGGKSVVDHVREINQLANAGLHAEAQSKLADFATFAQHMAEKAEAFNGGMTKLVEENGSRLELPKYKTTTKGSNGTSKVAFLDRHNASSQALVDAVVADAAHVTGAYNALMQRFGQQPGMVSEATPAQITAIASPTWRQARPGVASSPAEATAPAASPSTAPVTVTAEPAPATPPAATQTSTTSPSPARDVAPTPTPSHAAPADASAPQSAPADGQGEAAQVAPGDAASETSGSKNEGEASRAAPQAEVKPADIPLPVDFNNTARAPQAELDRALNMRSEDYLAAVNPDTKTTELPSDDTIDAELADTEPGSRAEEIGRHGDVVLKADGNYLYAQRGEDTVGLLVHGEDGNTLMVHSGERGTGLGRAMMRELITRKPFAQSNGLSAGAQATRLSVLRQLREERALAPAQPAATVAERLPGLPATLGEITESTPAAEAYARSNKLLSSFKLNPHSRSLFTRFASPLRAIRQILGQAFKAETPELVRSLYTDDQRFVRMNQAQLKAMGELFGQVAPTIARMLNVQLANFATGKNAQGKQQGKWNYIDPVTGNTVTKDFPGAKRVAGKAEGFLADLLAGKPVWNYANRLDLHAAQWGTDAEGKPFIHYQPQVAEAMALAGVHWVISMINMPPAYDREKLEKLYPAGIPSNIDAAYQRDHYYEASTKELARQIQDLLGLSAAGNASQSYTAGITYSLAQATIAAMTTLSLLDVIEEPTGTGRNVATFYRFNKLSTGENEAKGTFGLQAQRDVLERPALLTRMLFPDATDQPVLGTAPKDVDARIDDANGQKLASDQRAALRNESTKPHWLNMPLITDLLGLGKANVLRLLGYDERPLESLNKIDRRRVEGKNRGIEAGFDNLTELHDLVGMYADQNDTRIDQTPVFFPARMIGNTRIMPKAPFGPQPNKLARETISATKVTLDLTDARNLRDYYQALAQALGTKTEQVSPQQAMDDVHAMLTSSQYQYLFDTIRDFRDAEDDTENQADIGDDITAQIQALLPEGVTVHALHALFDYARMRDSAPEQLKAFETHLSFEHDGKTDGPFHALFQLGLWDFSKKTLGQLRQGGLLINTAQTTLNQFGKTLGDLYENVGARAGKMITAFLSDPKIKNGAKVALNAQLRLLAMAKHVKFSGQGNTSSNFTITRQPGKVGLMPMVYGSSGSAVVRTFVNGILEQVYSELSKSMAEQRELPRQLQKDLGMLMRNYKDGDNWVPAPTLDLSDWHDYANFEFHPLQVQALLDNFNEKGAGEIIAKAVKSEVAPVLSTFNLLYRASAFQIAQFRALFEEAREAKRLELVEQGKLGPNDALSRDDERALLNELRGKAPVYQLLHNTGHGAEADKAFGINIAERNRSNIHTVNGTKQQARSTAGGSIGLDIPSTQIAEAGVRIAALLVQALGDATMMTEIAKANPHGTLLVFDGWNTSPGSLEQRGREANQAVLTALRYDGLKAVTDSFASMDLDPTSLSPEALQALFDALRPNEDEVVGEFNEDGEMVPDLLATVDSVLGSTRSDLNARQRKNALVRDALLNQGRTQIAVDHMAGAEGPALIEGPLLDDDTLVGRIQEDVAAELEKQAIAAKTQAPRQVEVDDGKGVSHVENAPGAQDDPELFKRLGLQRGQLVTLDQGELELLLHTFPFANRVHKFLATQLSKLLGSDLNVHFGTPAQLVAKAAELFPDAESFPDFANSHGVYWNDTLFVARAHPETLLHELVHATTYAAVRRFYSGAKGLSAHQRDAVRSLQTLAQEFLSLDGSRWSVDAQQALDTAQEEVRQHFASEHPAEAVQEFLAWALTNPALAQALQQTRSTSALKTMAKTVLALVRKVLGLPENVAVESFLAQTLGQFHRLSRRPLPAAAGVGPDPQMDLGLVLHQAIPGTSQANSAYEMHLRDIAESMNSVLGALPRMRTKDAKTQIEGRLALTRAFEIALKSKEDFLAAGFAMTPRAQHVFEQVQAVLALAAPLDSATLHTFQELYDAVMPQLDPKDFLDDPNDTSNPAQTVAQARYNALLHVRYSDAQNRSTLLANFVALGLTDPMLRAKLATMTLPKTLIDKGSIDNLLKTLSAATFDRVEQASLKITPTSPVLAILDQLSYQLGKIQQAGKARADQAQQESRFDGLEGRLRQGLGYVANRAERALNARLDANLTEGVQGWLNGLLLSAQSLGGEQQAVAAGENLIKTLNQSNLPRVIRQLIGEVVGTMPSTESLARLVNKSRYLVAQVRQGLRDQAPSLIRSWFTTKLSEAQLAGLHTAVGKTDLQVFLHTHSAQELAQIVRNPVAWERAMASLEHRLRGLAAGHLPAWSEDAKRLGYFMVTGENTHELLPRNAYALARRAGQAVAVDDKVARQAEPLLDQMATLYALRVLSEGHKELLADLLERDGKAMTRVLTLQRALVEGERAKPGAHAQRYNAWKGFLPQSWDTRSDVVLAGHTTGAELEKRGYIRLRSYQGDLHDPLNGLSYYVTRLSGGQATYNQGAMQTVESTVGGVDKLSGRTLAPNVKSLIDHPPTVAKITRAKRRAYHAGQSQNSIGNLVPRFNGKGEVDGYERVLDPAVLDQHLRGKPDLSQAMGMWLGRQAEESLASTFNSELVQLLKNRWDEDVKNNREEEYIDIAHAQVKSLREAWEAVPRETQRQLKEVFGERVMVRKDMVDNAFGYRSASVSNIFTGASDLPEGLRKTLEDVALGLAGAHFRKVYVGLTQGEKAWQGIVAHSKEWIVVRSGVVAFANAFSNQLQLLQMGISPLRLLPMQAAKVREAQQYVRNRSQLNQLTVQMSAATTIGERARLERQTQLLNDANRRLSIWPLIEAGELPTISEGLSEQDEYGLLQDATKWVNDRIEKLPQAAQTAVKYATISKDTALYQGLNRMIQFGDFMAKATLYDHLVAQGMSSDAALARVSESFVNYNLKAGRTRDYLENMGVTWFYNYKLRIQKIVLRNLRENPLRFLIGGIGAPALGADSLLSSSAPATNWAYGFGLGQFWRSHQMSLWGQLFD